MATIVNFNGRRIVEPGFYSVIKGGNNSPIQDLSSGNVLIIDSGSGATWGGGSGISGEQAQGLSSVYSFDNLEDFRGFVKGGIWWDLADYLFNPLLGANGVTRLMIVRAATTTSATIAYTLTNGTLTFKTKHEGVFANGVASSSVLRKGFGCTMKAGLNDPTKFMFEFYQGTFKGLDPDGSPYGGISEADSMPILLVRSKEVATIAEFVTWASTDSLFQAYFSMAHTITTAPGTITSGDLVANTAMVLATGATETYDSTAFDRVLDEIAELDNTFFLSDKWGEDAKNALNVKILSHILGDEIATDKFLFVGGGNDETRFKGNTNASVEVAQFYNSARAVVVHGGVKITTFSGTTKNLPSIYHTATVLGRLAGLAPEQSLTFKTTRLNNFRHILKKKDREFALQNGVLHSRFVPGIGFVVNDSINTLQEPKSLQLFNPSGESYDIGIMRIAAQLNKELSYNGRAIFVGGNLFDTSPADLKSFVEGYLTQKLGTLIISFKKVEVKQQGDSYFVSYCFSPNSPIKKIFATGFMIDPNLSAS
jgi:hypothetical protein